MAIVGLFWDPRIFAGFLNLSGDLRQVNLAVTVPMLDASTFGTKTKINVSGIPDVAITSSGNMPIAAADLKEATIFSDVGASLPVTIMPTNTPAEGDPAFLMQISGAQLQFGGAFGALEGFSLSGAINAQGYPLIKGYVLETGVTARSGTWNSAGSNNLGAITASQFLYAVLHVTGFASPTSMVVTIESAAAGTFVGATTRATFTTVTTNLTSQYLARVAGPVTDTYWRVKAVITGTSYTFACACGKA